MVGVTAEATFDNQPHAILADDDHVVVLVNSSVSRGSKAYSGNTVFVFHVNGDKVTEVWSVPKDPYALDAFWEIDETALDALISRPAPKRVGLI